LKFVTEIKFGSLLLEELKKQKGVPRQMECRCSRRVDREH
jgi:hypothetical protein